LKGVDLSFEQICKVLTIIKEIVKPELLVLFGGEPLIRDDIEYIVDEVNRLGFEYTLITNGSIDKERTIKKLKGLTLSIDRPESFIDGTDERVKSNWAMLRKYKDIVPDLVANITVTHENVDMLDEIVDKLNELDVWVIFGYVHSTRNENEKAMFRSYCPKLTINADDLQTFKKVFYKAKKRHNTKAYVEEFGKYFNQMDWHCRLNPRNPEYMTIANNGLLLACNDHWGSRVTNYTIFQLPTIGMENWSELCKQDREECGLQCFFNHELNLAYPDENSLVHKCDSSIPFVDRKKSV